MSNHSHTASVELRFSFTYSDQTKVGEEGGKGGSQSKHQQMLLGSYLIITLIRGQQDVYIS